MSDLPFFFSEKQRAVWSGDAHRIYDHVLDANCYEVIKGILVNPETRISGLRIPIFGSRHRKGYSFWRDVEESGVLSEEARSELQLLVDTYDAGVSRLTAGGSKDTDSLLVDETGRVVQDGDMIAAMWGMGGTNPDQPKNKNFFYVRIGDGQYELWKRDRAIIRHKGTPFERWSFESCVNDLRGFRFIIEGNAAHDSI